MVRASMKLVPRTIGTEMFKAMILNMLPIMGEDVKRNIMLARPEVLTRLKTEGGYHVYGQPQLAIANK